MGLEAYLFLMLNDIPINNRNQISQKSKPIKNLGNTERSDK